MKNKLALAGNRFKEGMISVKNKILTHKSKGVDKLLVTVGMCIIALVLILVMKDQLTDFITTIFANMTTKAQGILGA